MVAVVVVVVPSLVVVVYNYLRLVWKFCWERAGSFRPRISRWVCTQEKTGGLARRRPVLV